jgi:hypothetical protein
MQARVAREEMGLRRTIVWVQMSAAGVLLISTLLAWENHPRVIHRGGRSPTNFVREVSHSIGLVTRPAGILAFVLGVLAIGWAKQLRNGERRSGWMALGLALATAAVCAVEIVQLLLDRRNWLGNLTKAVQPSLLGNAVGVGVWLAAAASIALVASAVTYLWFAHRVWRDSPTTTH